MEAMSATIDQILAAEQDHRAAGGAPRMVALATNEIAMMRTAIGGSAGPLWCLHVRGPDDVVPMRSYDEALALADWFTAVDRGNMADEDCPLFAAVPAVWPWSAEQHADDLARRDEKGSDYPLTLNPPRGDIVTLTKIALDHPLCKIGKAARTSPLPVSIGIENDMIVLAYEQTDASKAMARQFAVAMAGEGRSA